MLVIGIELIAVIILCVMGCVSLGLSDYIISVEDGQNCMKCDKRSRCFAYKKIGKKTNWLNEFMLLTYYKVYTRCKEVHKVTFNKQLKFCVSNTIFLLILFWSKGMSEKTILYAFAVAMLLQLSIVDWNTQYIPIEYTFIIFICGLIHLFADFSNWLQYLIGLIAVSGFLYIVNRLATPILKKKYNGVQEIDNVIGDGDVKLMAATGLLLGWKLNFIALGLGCVIGSIIQVILMKVKESDRQFALGPYLSLGVYITMICGEQLVSWYLNMIGFSPM